MSNDAAKVLENALTKVNEERRGFLKKLLIGSAAAAILPLMTSSVVAQDDGPQGDGPQDDGDGQTGKGTGKGKGRKGKGKGGKGKGKGNGDGGDASPQG
jgi:hypothetical protein